MFEPDVIALEMGILFKEVCLFFELYIQQKYHRASLRHICSPLFSRPVQHQP